MDICVNWLSQCHWWTVGSLALLNKAFICRCRTRKQDCHRIDLPPGCGIYYYHCPWMYVWLCGHVLPCIILLLAGLLVTVMWCDVMPIEDSCQPVFVILHLLLIFICNNKQLAENDRRVCQSRFQSVAGSFCCWLYLHTDLVFCIDEENRTLSALHMSAVHLIWYILDIPNNTT